MSNKVLLKKSSVGAKVPLLTDLDYGEVALNYADGKLYFKNSSNVITAFGASNTIETLTNKTINLSNNGLSGTVAQFNNALSDGDFATLAGTETLSNKTLYNTTFTGDVLINNTTGSGGSSEGGELHFAIPPANTSLNGPIAVDIYENKFRVFETTGTNRGVFLDLTAASAGVASGLVTTDGTQTLSNKTLSGLTLTGPITTSGNTGANGYILVSAGVGAPPQWQANTAGSLDGLTDVVITAPAAQQILKFNGSIWQNADPDVNIASAVFATNAESDLGSVTDLVIGTSEDLGLVTEVAAYIYNMGALVVDGIVSLNNIDQSIKADYIAYSIIFGF